MRISVLALILLNFGVIKAWKSLDSIGKVASKLLESPNTIGSGATQISSAESSLHNVNIQSHSDLIQSFPEIEKSLREFSAGLKIARLSPAINPVTQQTFVEMEQTITEECSNFREAIKEAASAVNSETRSVGSEKADEILDYLAFKLDRSVASLQDGGNGFGVETGELLRDNIFLINGTHGRVLLAIILAGTMFFMSSSSKIFGIALFIVYLATTYLISDTIVHHRLSQVDPFPTPFASCGGQCDAIDLSSLREELASLKLSFLGDTITHCGGGGGGDGDIFLGQDVPSIEQSFLTTADFERELISLRQEFAGSKQSIETINLKNELASYWQQLRELKQSIETFNNFETELTSLRQELLMLKESTVTSDRWEPELASLRQLSADLEQSFVETRADLETDLNSLQQVIPSIENSFVSTATLETVLSSLPQRLSREKDPFVTLKQMHSYLSSTHEMIYPRPLFTNLSPPPKFSASSSWGAPYHAPDASVLHKSRSSSRRTEACWHRGKDTGDQEYLQVELGNNYLITEIQTRGRSYAQRPEGQHIQHYRIEFLNKRNENITLKNLDGGVEFDGNYDATSVSINTYFHPFIAHLVRIYPFAYYGNMCLNWELIGVDAKFVEPFPNFSESANEQ